jgi:hypothetical protein
VIVVGGKTGAGLGIAQAAHAAGAAVLKDEPFARMKAANPAQTKIRTVRVSSALSAQLVCQSSRPTSATVIQL